MAKFQTAHVSYYVNVGQVIAVIGGVYVAIRAIRLKEYEAGLYDRSFSEVFHDFVNKFNKR